MGMMTRRNVKARFGLAPNPATVDKVEKPAKKEVSLSDKVKSSGLTKTEINRMTTAELQEIAKSFGVKGAEEMSGNQIKKTLTGALED